MTVGSMQGAPSSRASPRHLPPPPPPPPPPHHHHNNNNNNNHNHNNHNHNQHQQRLQQQHHQQQQLQQAAHQSFQNQLQQQQHQGASSASGPPPAPSPAASSGAPPPPVPRWAPNLADALRKSAFLPYRPPHCTVLTNLQRGNTQAKTPELQEPDASFHNRAGRGEITEDEILLEKNIDMLDENGLTGLHWAASYGQVAATTNLLRCGASVNCVGLEGETALLLAAAGGHHDVLRILLREGADVNHQDSGGNTALMYAAGGDYPFSCYELLLKGADLTLTNECDQDAYGIATTNGSKMAQHVIENFLVASLLKM